MHLTLVVLLALIPLTTSTTSTTKKAPLSCYVCNSNEAAACSSSDPEELNQFKQVCSVSLSEPHCRTITQTIDKVKSIVRTCGSKATSKSCYKTAGVNSANVCSCSTDFCNSAPKFNQAQQIMTILSSIIVMAITILMLR